MFFLFEALWYSLLIIIKLLFWPAVIIAMIALILWGYAKIKKEREEEKKKKKKK